MAMHLSLLRTRVLLSALVLALHTTFVSALSQTYCSGQNTGSGFVNIDTSIYQSNGRCHDFCNANYAFAVVQYDKCWCSNYIPSSQQSISKCDDHCPGFPDELCGSKSAGLFGYISLDIKPSGTAGASASSVSKSTSSTSTVLRSSSVISSSVSTASPSSSSSVLAAVISTTSAGRTSSSPSPSSSSSSRTKSVVTSVVVEETVTEDQTFSTSFSTSPPTAAATTSPSTTPKATSTSSKATTTGMAPVTSLQVVTLSGSVVTQTVTSTPIPSSGAMLGKEKSQNIAPGFIVAAVIASIAGIVLLCLALFWCYRRRRIAQDNEKYAERMRNPPSSELDRNVSVHSKAGLLDSAYPPQLITRFSSYNLGLTSSDATSPASLGERRNSRHLVDQRLNPNLLMVHDNGSHISIQTLEDHRDYGRILKVANPDYDERKSFS